MTRWLPVVAVAVLIAGCSADTSGDAEGEQPIAEAMTEETPEPTEEQVAEAEEAGDEPESTGGDRLPEENMAIIDGEGDDMVIFYTRALDRAEQACPESREQIADIAVGSIQILDEQMPGYDVRVLDMLNAITESADAADGQMECTSVAATLLVLLEQGMDL